MKTKLVAAKNAVQAHSTQILTYALATTTVIALVQQKGIQGLNNFLKENDLFDAYYNSNEES